MSRPLLAIGALFGALAVALGAFGAHGLEGRVVPDRLEIWETAAHYLGWHAAVLVALGLSGLAVMRASRLALASAVLMVLGTLIFSGSLFVLVITDETRWGMVTPIGGLALVIAWLLLALSALFSVRGHSSQSHDAPTDP